jgi:hypothetical protein
MKMQVKQVFFVCAAMSMVVLWAAAGFGAPYDFEFTATKYASEDTLWAPQDFGLVIQNTGTNADTIDLLVTTDAPPGWSGSLCIAGRCLGPSGYVALGPGETEDLSVLVFTGGVPDMGLASITGTMRAGSVIKTETFAVFINVPSILLVDDDAGMGYETYMDAALDSAGYDCHVWDAAARGRPGAARLSSYREVLWTTADGDASYLTGGDESDLMTFLNGGGNLCLASMGFLSSRGGTTTFTADYLHLNGWTDNVGGTVMVGVSGSAIGDGMNLDLSGGPFATGGIDKTDPNPFPAESFFESAGTDTTGIGVDENGHKLVFLAFPFECVPVSGADPDNQKTLMARIMDWFSPPVAGIGGSGAVVDAGMLRQNSPNPFTGSTIISFALPRGTAGAKIEIYNVEGRLLRSLPISHTQGGEASVVWNGKDSAGRCVASGVYFYKLAGGPEGLKKMVLLE